MREALGTIFLQSLGRLSLDRLIPERMSCRNGVLEVGGEKIDLKRYRRVFAVAFGKAGFQMS
ncbi:MAG: hypothetical protein ACE5JI_13135, partial [Acidobacteriota bacterium]